MKYKAFENERSQKRPVFDYYSYLCLKAKTTNNENNMQEMGFFHTFKITGHILATTEMIVKRLDTIEVNMICSDFRLLYVA